MNLTPQEILVIATALIATAVSSYIYVMGVLDKDRMLSRSAAAAFFVFGIVAVVFFWRAI